MCIPIKKRQEVIVSRLMVGSYDWCLGFFGRSEDRDQKPSAIKRLIQLLLKRR